MNQFDPKISTVPLLQQVLADLGNIQGAAENFTADRVLNKEKLFPTVEDKSEPPRQLICYLSGPGGGGIDHSDAAPIGSMLDSIGECENLDLMINSPGGSGEAAEKLIEMCRAHCRREFRVVVPNYAKSAATMIALGADVIVMGYLSELGPIDPQYQISVGNTIQVVSGQSFVQAYENVQEEVKQAVAAGQSPVGYLHSLSASTMEPAFIEHCRRGIDFSRDIAKKFLPKYQFPALLRATGETRHPSTLKKWAKRVAEDLLSANTRFSHGRLISADEAKDVGLHVDILDRQDAAWGAYWELYVRGEVYMQSRAVGDARVTKLFFDRTSTLPAY
ncbi:MAG: hypothetical protein M3321_08570 [Actinomycetota bacterium]|nr:hypothetical protein [Actinomycetota bacterium]